MEENKQDIELRYKEIGVTEIIDVWLVRNDIIRQNIRFESWKMIESDENSTFRIFIWVFYCPKYCKSAIRV